MTSLPVRLALAVASGLAAGLAFEPFAFAYLLPLAVAGVTLAVAGLRPGRGFVVGLVFGVAFMGLLLPWLQVIHPVAWPALTLLEALFYGLGGWATAVVVRLRFWPVWAAAVWVAVEWLRGSIPFGGFPWGRLGFAVVDTPVLPSAAYLGVAGVTFLVALVGTTIAWLVRDGRRHPVRGVALLAAVLLLAVAASATTLPGTPGPTEEPAVATVAAVQGDVPGVGLDAFSERRAVLDNHVRATVGHGQAKVRRQRPSLRVVAGVHQVDVLEDVGRVAALDVPLAPVDGPMRDIETEVMSTRTLDGWHPSLEITRSASRIDEAR